MARPRDKLRQHRDEQGVQREEREEQEREQFAEAL